MFLSALRAWWDDDAPRLGASLAYYTLFAFAPILLVATAIAGMVFGAEAVRGELVGQLDHLIERKGARAVQSLLEGAQPTTDWDTRHGLRQHHLRRRCHASIPRTSKCAEHDLAGQASPGINFKAFVLDRVRSFGRVVAIGFLLMVSLAVTAALTALNGWLARYAPSIPVLWSGVSMFVSLIVTTGLFTLLFRFLPDVHLRWRDVMTGALATAVLFTIGQQLIGLYLGQSSMSSSYGAAGSVMILLLWVYYSCQILLFGAEFTRVYAQRDGMKPAPESFAEKDPDAPG
jgi:membrane protein